MGMMTERSQSISPLRVLTLDLPPSCIEFCPAHPTFFVVGTYELQQEEASEPVEVQHDDARGKKQQNRNGSLVVFQLKNSDLVKVQTVQHPSAVFDLHFHPVHTDVLAVVSSTGTVSFFRLTSSGSLEELCTHAPLGSDEGVLFTYCAWHPILWNLLAITTADFRVHILRVDGAWNLHVTNQEPAASHAAEAWVVAFLPTLPAPKEEDGSQELTMFSGGDDSRLLSTSLLYTRPEALDDDDTDCIKRLYPSIGFRGHGAGVTAILPLPIRLSDGSSVVVTGSYDDHIRVYRSFGAFRAAQLVAEENLGGGVWRIKTIKLVHEVEDQWRLLLLVSCMHAGARIVEIVGGDSVNGCSVEVLARFEEHKSMNYGSDYAPESRSLSGTRLQCVSTSFYDRLLCLWEYSKLD